MWTSMRSGRVLVRVLAGALVSGLILAGTATPAAAAPLPPDAFGCKTLLDPAAPTLFGTPVVELPPTTLTATWDPEIKRIIYDNPLKNCKWSAVYGKVVIDFTVALITPAERADIRDRWLTAYGLSGVPVGGDNYIYHRWITGYGRVESAAVLSIPYYVTAVATDVDSSYFPAFIQGQADQVTRLYG
jgi:hypothetical protein